MDWQPLTPDHIFDDCTLEIACDGEYAYLRDKTFTEHMLPIPLQNMGGVFAGQGVGSEPECRSGETSAYDSPADNSPPQQWAVVYPSEMLDQN